MIVAVPAEEKSLDSAICVSFGRAPIYCLYDTEKETSTFLDNKAAEASGGAGIQAAQFLADQKIDSLITFRLGENASKVLSAANISILKALNLSIADNIANLLEGKLTSLNEVHPGFHHAH
ncbi:MAG: NifB/NifX family molybdenum-iron cluster-binding protein [Sphaerochaetaceae bacterium]|nr:NifB/NifX family molybdenum-iron cluster-binding protein [uncultured Sphaerochaeta sp.]MDC7229562.1 NifB/NifX family molybdenum-iron cluster-binding protein [Sphaerochaetaceae bacterium]